MLASLSITLTTLPIQIWFYYEIPVYSVFLNLLVLPFMSMLMTTGLLAMLVPGLGILGTIDCLILSGYEWLCLWCERLPFHTWNPGKPETWQMVVYYLILLGFVVVKNGIRQKDTDRVFKRIVGEQVAGKGGKHSLAGKIVFGGWISKMVQIGTLTMAVVLLTCNFRRENLITFLDVGQGDCICVQTASGEVYLFDCGSSSRSEVGKYVLKPYLKYYGISHVDAVFLSHSDSDHCNGAEELLAQGAEWGITVGRVFLPGEIRAGTGWQSGTTGIQQGEFGQSDVRGDFFTGLIGQNGNAVRCTCLHPALEEGIEGTNADSQCFYIEFENGISILLTGDVEGAGEESLLQELQKRQITKVSVLKVAHHGSRYSTSEEFLTQIQPKLAVISCGKNNQYGHPHAELLERLDEEGCIILTTPECGAITVEVSAFKERKKEGTA